MSSKKQEGLDPLQASQELMDSPLTQGMAIQLVAIGMVIASKEVRKQVDPEDWQAWDMGVVVSEIQHHGGPDKAYGYLKRWLLDLCGVDWKLPSSR